MKLVDDTYASPNLSCEQKSAYAADFLSKVQTAITMKTFAAEQLQAVINASNSTYNNLTFQIS